MSTKVLSNPLRKDLFSLDTLEMDLTWSTIRYSLRYIEEIK